MKAVKLGRPPGIRMAIEKKALNTAFSLTKEVIDKITKEAEKQGISKSEFVRKVIIAYEVK